MKEYLKNKAYRALINAAVLNGIGNSLFNIVFVIYASQITPQKLAVSIASITMFIPSLLQIVMGYAADQTKAKVKLLLWTRLVQAILFVGLAGLVLLPNTFGLFLVLLVINVTADCLGSYAGGLQLPLLKQIIPESELNAAMGFQAASQTIVQIIFQGVGAWAIVLIHYNYSLFGIINALMFLLSATVIFKERTILTAAEPHKAVQNEMAMGEKKDRTGKGVSFKTSVTETFSILTDNRFLARVLVFAFVINSLFASLDGLITITLLDHHELWLANFENTVAMIGMTISIGIIAGSLVDSDPFKKTGLIPLVGMVGLLLLAFSLNMMTIRQNWLMILILFATGYLLGKLNPRMGAYMLKTIPQDKLAIVNGVFGTVVLIGAPLGQFIFLGIGNMWNVTLSWALFAIGTVVIIMMAIKDKTSDPTQVKNEKLIG